MIFKLVHSEVCEQTVSVYLELEPAHSVIILYVTSKIIRLVPKIYTKSAA